MQNSLLFIELLDQMKYIHRSVILQNSNHENNAEHSYHLAMMVLILAPKFPKLSLEKCLIFALVHDIVEIYAWDTIALDIEAEKTKHEREQKSIQKLENDFWKEHQHIFKSIHEYENKSSQEVRFVYSLDKIHPIIQEVLSSGKWWKEWKMDFDKIKQRQYWKIFPEFWLDKILDIYFAIAEEKNIYFQE